MSKFKKWTVLQNLNSDFVSNIKSVYIFGKNGKNVIVITNDDHVYAFGDNSNYGILGLGHTNAIQEPTKIKELCGKQVIQIEFGCDYKHILALTQNGDVFSWGCNEKKELGNGNNDTLYNPTIVFDLNGNNVIDIKAGNYSFALTESNDVFVWGCYENLTKIKFELHHQKINSIFSGLDYALVLTNDGKVYYWGSTSYGQCGNSGVMIFRRKCLQNFKFWSQSKFSTDLNIIKIACGPNHTLMLSRNGNLYGSFIRKCVQIDS